jgi:hypothetical protein
MEQKASFIGGTPGQDVDPAQLEEALHNIMKQPAQSGAPALGMFTQLQQRREQRLGAAAKGLAKPLGKDHPDVVAVENAAKSLTALRARISTQAARVKSWPKVRPNEWIVFGTVIDAQNKPAAGLTVRVYDRDRKYDDLLGETETDANGDFAVVYHERDFKESNENLAELYLMVSDAKGSQLYSSQDNIRFEAGKSEYFAIRLGMQTRAAKAATAKKSKAAATTTKASTRKK